MSKTYTGAPVHKAYLSATWTPGRFSANVGAMGIWGLYLATGENPVTSNYVNLKARLSYRLFDRITLFVRGENLLNQKYQTMIGFPEPGITVMGGVSITL